MSPRMIYLLALIEGVLVIFVELLGVKLLMPYFGNSYSIWTSTVGVTMSSLLLGYLFGGFISRKSNAVKFLYTLYIITSIWILFMPDMIELLVKKVSEDIIFSSLITTIKLIAIPLILLGTTIPVLVQLLSIEKLKAGEKSGLAYSISTIGGIISTLVLGFFIIEKYGVSNPIRFGSIILIFASSVAFYKIINNKVLIFLSVLSISTLYYFRLNQKYYSSKLLHISEGIQGQLKVFDEILPNQNTIRHLQINGIDQTSENISQKLWGQGEPFSRFIYPHVISYLSSCKNKGSNALLLGYGGGSIYRELKQLDFDVDVVEIDKRLIQISRDFFFNRIEDQNIFIDDARHFIKQSKKSYDIIVIDLLHGEVQPSHILTSQGLSDIKKVMNNDAILIFNFQSVRDEPLKPYLSIFKTLHEAGFKVLLSEGDSYLTDYLFFCSNKDFKDISFTRKLNFCCEQFKINNPFLFNNFKDISELDTLGYYSIKLLDDRYPKLDVLNRETILKWRSDAIEQNSNNKTVGFK